MIAAAPTLPEAPSQDRLARFCGDVHIDGPDVFRIGDGPPIAAPEAGRSPVPGRSPAEARARAHPTLRDSLATAIYTAAYARTYRGPGFDPAALQRFFAPDPDHVAALDAANPSRAAWEKGWRIFACDPDGSVHAAKGDTPQKWSPGRFVTRDLLRPPRPGDEVERVRERSSLTHQPGLYHAFGEAPRDDYDDARLSRFYFDVGAGEAAWLLATVAGVLNRFGVPFTYKCPVDPAAYDRLDAGVLYVARRHVPTVLDLLHPLADAFRSKLRDGVPLWTRPVFPGVGAADDPGTGESFGQSRSALVAGALVDAWAAGRSDLPFRLDAVAAEFQRVGLSSDKPHLGIGLAEVYAVAEGVKR